MQPSTSTLLLALTTLLPLALTQEFCAGTVYKTYCCLGALTGSNVNTGSSFSLGTVPPTIGPTGVSSVHLPHVTDPLTKNPSLTIHIPIPIDLTSTGGIIGGRALKTSVLASGVTCVGGVSSYNSAATSASASQTSAPASKTSAAKTSAPAKNSLGKTTAAATSKATKAAASGSKASSSAAAAPSKAAAAPVGVVGVGAMVGAGLGLMMAL